MATDSAAHFSARIARLFVYPVKSCRGVELREALLTPTGLHLDRAWMVVDGAGVGLTQRELPRLALVHTQLGAGALGLQAPGMQPQHLPFDTLGRPVRVRVWSDEVAAHDMGDAAARWFTGFLGRPLRLVRFDTTHRRLTNPKWTGGIEAPNQFTDGYPLNVVSEASLQGLNARLARAGHAAVGIERLRPNLVLAGAEAHDEDRVRTLHVEADGPLTLALVKPCERCPIPNIDPETAHSHPAVGDTLQGYRRHPHFGGAVTFGMYAIALQGQGLTLRTGQAVTGEWAFD
jgi:hypothetical protein